MKPELLYAEKFKSAEDFIKALDEYIDYYNNKRIKSRLKERVRSNTELFQYSLIIYCTTFLGHFTPPFYLLEDSCVKIL